MINGILKNNHVECLRYLLFTGKNHSREERFQFSAELLFKRKLLTLSKWCEYFMLNVHFSDKSYAYKTCTDSRILAINFYTSYIE